jgi:hypothetical protein
LAIASLVRRSFPTPFLIARTLTKTRRRIWTLILVPLAIVAAPPLWWLVQLAGLPDIGDPFDVGAFRKFTISDERNAFVMYSQAATLLKRDSTEKRAPLWSIGLDRWSKVGPSVRQSVEENREALGVYRQGAERPDAFDPSIGRGRESYKTLQALWGLRPLILLEASRLEDAGEMAAAWGWYRAMFRTIHHVGMRGDANRRRFVQRWHRELCKRVDTWAADQRTSPALLRQALADAEACNALARSEQDSLKLGYIDVLELLDLPENPGRDVPLWRFARYYHPDYTLNPEQIQTVWDWWRFWRAEPERSRRVIRLLTANWLAYLDLPAGNRPKPDIKAASFDLYALGPNSPAEARALSPEAIDRWFASAYDAQQALSFMNPFGVRELEQAHDTEILVALAEALYRRDHGTDPPSPEALVGPYLKSLPAALTRDENGNRMPSSSRDER